MTQGDLATRKARQQGRAYSACLLCADCYLNTSRAYEYYIVNHDVWYVAMRVAPKVRFLCIGCLEKRLGYTLCKDDFLEVPLNIPGFQRQSERFLIRLTSLTRRVLR
jgi:hypothetical protein